MSIANKLGKTNRAMVIRELNDQGIKTESRGEYHFAVYLPVNGKYREEALTELLTKYAMYIIDSSFNPLTEERLIIVLHDD